MSPGLYLRFRALGSAASQGALANAGLWVVIRQVVICIPNTGGALERENLRADWMVRALGFRSWGVEFSIGIMVRTSESTRSLR